MVRESSAVRPARVQCRRRGSSGTRVLVPRPGGGRRHALPRARLRAS
jgi:hypothetical protein